MALLGGSDSEWLPALTLRAVKILAATGRRYYFVLKSIRTTINAGLTALGRRVMSQRAEYAVATFTAVSTILGLLFATLLACSDDPPTGPPTTGTITGVITNWQEAGLPEIRIDLSAVAPKWEGGRFTVGGIGPGIRCIDIWKQNHYTLCNDTVWIDAGRTLNLGSMKVRDILVDTVIDHALTLNPYSIVQSDVGQALIGGRTGTERGYLVADMGADEWIVADSLAQEDFRVIVGSNTDADYWVYVSADGQNFIRVVTITRIPYNDGWERAACHVAGTGLDSVRFVKVENRSEWFFEEVELIAVVGVDCIHPANW